MKELAQDKSLLATGTMVEVDHPTRGKYLSVGNPIKMSASPSDVKRSPLLGEHTEEVLRELLSMQASDLERLTASGAIAIAPAVVARH
jgi:formyl-CoA transferase